MPNEAAVTELQAVYGPPVDAGMGSGVFRAKVARPEDLEAVARAQYRHFLGPLWERFGGAAWLAPWAEVHLRAPGAPRDIVAELRALTGPGVSSSADMLLEAAGDAGRARRALAGAFDAPDVERLACYALGDDGAYAGLLVASRAGDGDGIFLVFLMD
jgi:hypothetical protein